MTDATIKTCPKCSSPFTCSPAACWCAELPPVMPVDLDASCYCPKCLADIIKETIENKADGASTQDWKAIALPPSTRNISSVTDAHNAHPKNE
jgi:hypothetical protein